MDNLQNCVICLHLIENDKQFLPCAHLFHGACVDIWLIEKPTCPICKIPVYIGSSEQLSIYNNYKKIRENESDADSLFLHRVSAGVYDNLNDGYRPAINNVNNPYIVHGVNCTCVRHNNNQLPLYILDLLDSHLIQQPRALLNNNLLDNSNNVLGEYDSSSDDDLPPLEYMPLLPELKNEDIPPFRNHDDDNDNDDNDEDNDDNDDNDDNNDNEDNDNDDNEDNEDNEDNDNEDDNDNDNEEDNDNEDDNDNEN
jgi:hypothetical protein